MFKGFKTVRILLIFATPLSFALTGCTLYNISTEEVAISATSGPPVIIASPGALIFQKNCKSCHDLDRPVIGPALRGVFSRRDSVWVRNWITNSSKMISSGDPTAVALFEQYKKTQMTNFTTMSKEDLDAL